MTRRAFNRFMVDENIGHNLKLVTLTPAERWCHLAGVLAIAAKSPVRGRLLIGNTRAEAVHIARQAGVSKTTATSTLRKLRAIGVLIEDEEYRCERVHDWEDWNPEPRVDRTNAERQARYRERHNTLRNGQGNGVITPSNAVEVEVEGEEHPLVSAMAEDQHQVIEDWRPLPQRPRSHASKACDRWERELATWCAVHIPEVPTDIASAAAKQAIDDHCAVTASDLLEHFADGDYPYAARGDVRRLLAKHNRHVA